MSDAADRADSVIQGSVDAALDEARHALSQRALLPCGVCHWCGETLHHAAALYCDSDCAADHAADQRRITGKCL